MSNNRSTGRNRPGGQAGGAQLARVLHHLLHHLLQPCPLLHLVFEHHPSVRRYLRCRAGLHLCPVDRIFQR